MNRNESTRTVILILILCVLVTLPGCTHAYVLPKPEINCNMAEIWCIESDSFAPLLSELTESFNTTDKAENCKISVRLFESEDLLAEALEDNRPMLLFCDQLIAESLNDRELLGSPVISSSSFAFEEYTKTADEYVGYSFFPIGAAVQLFAYNDRLNKHSVADFMSFCEQARGMDAAFLGIDDYSFLLNNLLLANGEKLQGEKENLKSIMYVDAYNCIAELAFCGALYLGEDEPIKLLEEGKLAAAYAFSDRIAEADQRELHISLSPMLEGNGRFCVAKVKGIAYTNENIEYGQIAVDFLKWLFCDGKTATAATQAGLLPAIDWKFSKDGSELEMALYQVKENCTVIAETNCREFIAISSEYEPYIRQALSIVAEG